MGRRSLGTGICVLGLVHLSEPIHSGEYLARILFAATEDFEITKGVFTITGDNASTITKMLKLSDAAAKSGKPTIQQPWRFRAAEGDIRCIAHVINLVVQAAPAILKAVPEEDDGNYHFEKGCACIPLRIKGTTPLQAAWQSSEDTFMCSETGRGGGMA